jgi:Flp pilus assembly protein TadG
MRGLKSFVRNEAGQGLAEFALVALVFFTLVFGIIDFCMFVYTNSFVTNAAQQGARYAMVRGADWASSCASVTSYDCQATAGDVQTYVLSLQHPGINLVASNITTSWPGTTAAGVACATANAQGCEVSVQVSYTFTLNIPGVPAASKVLTSTAVETIQN